MVPFAIHSILGGFVTQNWKISEVSKSFMFLKKIINENGCLHLSGLWLGVDVRRTPNDMCCNKIGESNLVNFNSPCQSQVKCYIWSPPRLHFELIDLIFLPATFLPSDSHCWEIVAIVAIMLPTSPTYAFSLQPTHNHKDLLAFSTYLKLVVVIVSWVVMRRWLFYFVAVCIDLRNWMLKFN